MRVDQTNWPRRWAIPAKQSAAANNPFVNKSVVDWIHKKWLCRKCGYPEMSGISRSECQGARGCAPWPNPAAVLRRPGERTYSTDLCARLEITRLEITRLWKDPFVKYPFVKYPIWDIRSGNGVRARGDNPCKFVQGYAKRDQPMHSLCFRFILLGFSWLPFCVFFTASLLTTNIGTHITL